MSRVWNSFQFNSWRKQSPRIAWRFRYKGFYNTGVKAICHGRKRLTAILLKSKKKWIYQYREEIFFSLNWGSEFNNMWICLVDISSRKRLIFLKTPLVISTSTTNQQDLLSDSSRLEAHGCQVSFLQLDEFMSQSTFSKLLEFIRSMKFSKLYSCSIIYTKKSGWRCFFQAVCQSAGYSRVPALASGSNFSSALPAGRARPSCLSQIKLTQC